MEIGAVCNEGRSFHRLVDPRYPGMTLQETFAASGQNPERTLCFWNKLFREKMILHRQRRAEAKRTMKEKLQQYDALFDGERFVSTRSALIHFMMFVLRGRVQSPLLVAHNGASFDHSIVRAHTERLELPSFDSACMKDSLQPARNMLPHFKSHSLGVLHKKLVKEPFLAHHALSDAMALYRVCHALAARENVELHHLWSSTHGSLTTLKGVGPKTARALRQHGYNLPSLKRAVLQHASCPTELQSCIRNYRSLWRQLRKKWLYPKPPLIEPAKLPEQSKHEENDAFTVAVTKSRQKDPTPTGRGRQLVPSDRRRSKSA